jgi:hypothetical protein
LNIQTSKRAENFCRKTKQAARAQLGTSTCKSVLSKPFASSSVCTKKRKNKEKKSKNWCKQKKMRTKPSLQSCVSFESSTGKARTFAVVRKNFFVQTHETARKQLGTSTRKSLSTKTLAVSPVCTKKRKNKVKKLKNWCKQKKMRTKT